MLSQGLAWRTWRMSEVKLTGDLKLWSDTSRKSKGHVLSTVERAHIGQPEDRAGAEFVHPSEVAKPDWCERATAQRMVTGTWPTESFNLIRENIFSEGDFIHEKWQRWMAKTGQLWGLWECPFCGVTGTDTSGNLEPYCHQCQCAGDEDGNPLDWWRYKEVPLKHGIISGHEDGAIGNHLVEVKSVGVGSLRMEDKEINPKCCGWKNWQALKMPLISHQIQGQLYLYMAQKMELPFDRLAVIYEFKPNQQVREFDLPFNMRLITPLLDRINSIEYALADGKLPACPYGGCKYCGKEDKKGTAPVRKARGRTSQGTLGDNRSARKRSDATDEPASSVGESHRTGTSGSGNTRKVRRRSTG
jgi:hypothetical protein